MRLFLSLILLFSLTVNAHAMEEEALDLSQAFSDHQPLLAVSRRAAITPEEIGMLFHKMTDQDPDFKQWAGNSPRVIDAKIIDRNSTFIKEYNRMKKAFRGFEDDDVITIHVTIDITEYSDQQNLLVLDEFNAQTYFSYPLYGKNYGVIPQGIEQFNMLRMTPDQYRGMRELTGMGSTLTAEILLKPILADPDKPMLLNEKDYWLIMADIAEIRFWTTANHVSQMPTAGLGWFYRAPDYAPEESDELMDLFAQ